MIRHLTHLRDLRDARNLSLRELADRSGVSKGLLSLAERGLYVLSPAQVQDVEIALGMAGHTLSHRLLLVQEEEAGS